VRYDADWRERALLRDGTPLDLRLVRPDDRALFLAAWDRLSEQSRYRRFLSPKPSLTARELRYLTDPDNVDHVAIGASVGSGVAARAVGVARFVRLTERADTAEAAVAVTDDFNRRGVGRLLLDRLASAARERGVEQFTCEVLAGNAPMRAMLRGIAPGAIEAVDGDIVVVEIPLGPAAPPGAADAPDGPLHRLLASVARGALALRRTAAHRRG
jgi:GNAT superfamily N-acetyltransferase